ncbi:MAG: O-antigen ligase family protein [Vicinamibacterales bacterium]|nr:O-antigen ligase family protein [Vicinamibacterales bacterium]
MPVQRLALAALLAGTLAAFGGIYPWATPFILAAAAIVCALGGAESWRVAPDTRGLHLAFGWLVAAVALQLLPLPGLVRGWLSPAADTLTARLRVDALLHDAGEMAALSIDPRATLHALALLLAVGLTYRAALTVFAGGGLRQLTRILAWTGVVVAGVAIVQRAVSPGRIYGYWVPDDIGAQPFGPVVNRNHLVAWFLMASALACGYMVARLRTRLDGPVVGASWRHVLRRVLDSGAPSMALAWAVMAATITVSRSRSGLIGLAVAVAVLWRGGATRDWHPRLATVVALLLSAGIGLALLAGDVPAITSRFAAGLGGAETDRTAIWRETLPIVSDFRLTGTGAGTFGMAMAGYQQTLPVFSHLDSVVRFNHAHNHYLQVAAEGGLWLALPALALLVAFGRLARTRMRQERGEALWLRLGAFAGLMAVAVQSLWEIPVTMPANALLAATMAAVVTYRRNGHE